MAKRLVENRMILDGKKLSLYAEDNCPRCHGRGIEGINPVERKIILCRCSSSKDHGPATREEIRTNRWEPAQAVAS